jgi:hypothetical protein
MMVHSINAALHLGWKYSMEANAGSSRGAGKALASAAADMRASSSSVGTVVIEPD